MAGQQRYLPGTSDTAPLPAVGRQAGPPPPPPSLPPPPYGPPRRRGPRLLLQGVGLLAVAVVAGFGWWLIRQDSGTSTPDVAETPMPDDPLVSGEFTYTTVAGPDISTDCSGNSYGDVAEWFTEHPCTRVSRALYSTGTGDERTLVSVVLVTMPTENEAQQLKVITDTDGTGNVNDLIRDGTAKLPGAPNVAQGEYESRSAGTEVTIVEAAFFDEHTDEALLARIGTDALRLSTTLR
ncbi:hypothetical protein ABZ863_20295 [Saccharomonospora sp. NPDC046836]|uniref:hypothetical protein n=1 Tax=Saccharomonospora sp. NPDC046836 TaxID=3156921 RepID=UPI0034051D51